jgi:FkbM family methyltransferase
MTVMKKLAYRVRDMRHLGPAFALREFAPRVERTLVSCGVKGVGSIVLRSGTSDAKTFQQVFRDRQYELTSAFHAAVIADAYSRILAAGRTPVIVDCGANNGAGAIWFAQQFPEAAVVAIEPDPSTAELCRRNTRGRNVVVRQAAVGAYGGTARMVTDGLDSWAYRTERDPDGDTEVVTISQAVDGVDNAELFIVKVDVEGFEAELFSAATEWVGDATAIFIEPHDWLFPGAGTSREFQRTMARHDLDVLLMGENLLYVKQQPGRER